MNKLLYKFLLLNSSKFNFSVVESYEFKCKNSNDQKWFLDTIKLYPAISPRAGLFAIGIFAKTGSRTGA